ncbi:hypothetical protein FEM48_Zijuj10G0172200 [Ziziphus jujuba var. spinosa]|uniref:Protein TIFY n=1 Tax=Ziziphus jujuba var. spinosa TaxID=714518 RepID=A0A978UPN9_ZIZJJ|nr:hypothetical protein FEM48_Zijuj10G0172200 [Ziziphus jujuba var. spinosa]
MSKATVELDFFGMERDQNSSSKSQFQKFLHSQRSFRGIQSAISKIDPEILKSVIASGSVMNNQMCSGDNAVNRSVITSQKSYSVPSSPKTDQILFPPLPVYVPSNRPISENLQESAPLTIFYNGTVSVFDVPRDKAEGILKIAFERGCKAVESATANAKSPLPSCEQQQLLDPDLNGDLPIARRKSLQRFLEKRKER